MKPSSPRIISSTDLPPRKGGSNTISRRRFLGQASCAAVGTASLVNSLLNLRFIGAAAAESTSPSEEDFKALICIFLLGGNDSYNMLAPYGSAEHQVYQQVRTDLALSTADLLQLNPLSYSEKTLGLHHSMGSLKQLFDDGHAAFITNVGTLIQPITKAQYKAGQYLPLGLFSHSDAQEQWQTSIPQSRSGIGWAGRMADLVHTLNPSDKVSMNISLSGSNVWQSGQEVFSYSIGTNGSTGLKTQNGNPMSDIHKPTINHQLDLEYANLYEKAFADTTRDAVGAHEFFSAGVDFGTGFQNAAFPNHDFGNKLEAIAQVIRARQALGKKRMTFFLGFGGWDHHDEVLDNQNEMLPIVADGLKAFFEATCEMGIEKQVTTVTLSDFARTLTSNGRGSDHAWGGNQIVVGGCVNGREIYGNYPDMETDNPLDAGRGRLIPSLSCDEFFGELALWFGVSQGDLDYILPNIGNFYSVSSGLPIGFMQMA